MLWLWSGWAMVAAAMVAVALWMGTGAIRARQGGANGLAWLAAMIVCGGGSLAVAGITWIARGAGPALAVPGVAAAALAAAAFVSVRVFQLEIRKALRR
jgi:hypothetical protein